MHYYSQREITCATAGVGEQTAPRHLYAAATGEGLSGSAVEQRELEGRATASAVVSVH